MTDQVKEILNVLDEFKTRMSGSKDRLHGLAGQVQQPVDPRSEFGQVLKALNATEARSTKLDREIAEVELMLKNWLSARSPSDPSTR